MKKYLLIVISAAFALGVYAQGPNGSKTYYQNADGKKGSALKTALYGIISKKTSGVGYSYDGLLEDYKKTDKRADGYLRDWYSPYNNYVIGGPAENHSYNGEGQSYNREHLVPQSWFGSGDPKSDIVHVVPADGWINNQRGNYPLADVKSATNTYAKGYCKKGSCATQGYTGTVFEPGADTKGDIARIYFYMATRYENLVSNWDGATASIVFAGNKYPAIKKWYLKMLFKWANDDPVDEVEIARNNAIYGDDVQKNRNPFVDYPGLEQYIWGNSKDVAFSYDNYQQPQYTGDNDVNVEDDSGSGTGEDPGGDEPGGGGTVIPSEGSNTYQLISSGSDLEVGKGYLIVCTEKGVAMSAQGNNIRGYADVTISGNTITTDVNESGKPYEITLGGSNGAYTLYDAKGGVYLSLTSSDNKLNTSTSVSSDKEKWTISISGDALISNKAYSDRSIYYNSGSPRFACYKSSSSQMPVQLYKSVTTTAIKQVNGKVYDGTVYDLSGRKLNDRKLSKGFYVRNGKKIIIN